MQNLLKQLIGHKGVHEATLVVDIYKLFIPCKTIFYKKKLFIYLPLNTMWLFNKLPELNFRKKNLPKKTKPKQK